MVSFEEIQTIYYMVAATGVLVAAAYYVITLRSSSKAQKTALESRNAQFFLQLYSSFDLEMLRISWNDIMGRRDWNTFEEWWEKHGPESNIEDFAKWLRSVILYEIYGVLVKRGFLDINLVDDIISGPTLMIWEVYKPIIFGIREKYGYPQFQEYQEYLANEIRKIVDKQHPDYRGTRD